MSEAIDIVALIKNEELAPVTQFSNQTNNFMDVPLTYSLFFAESRGFLDPHGSG